MSVELSGRRERVGRLPVELGAGAVLALLVAWLSIQFPAFRTPDNAKTILSSASEIAIVAAGMTVVIATGGIDISVGSVVGLCGVILGLLAAESGWNIWLAGIAAVSAGAACGLVNGVLIARFKLPPIIATLAMFSAARAGAYVLSKGNSISGLPDSITDLGYDYFPANGLPNPAWVAVLVLVVVGVALKFTAFGRSIKALGGNRETAFLSGIRTRRVEIMAYVVSGLLAGVAAIVVTARGATAIPDAGKYFELRAITAVVLGGTSIAGGNASMAGTALGVLTIGVVGNGVRTYGQAGIWEQLVLGVVLLAAVEVDRWRTRRNERGRT